MKEERERRKRDGDDGKNELAPSHAHMAIPFLLYALPSFPLIARPCSLLELPMNKITRFHLLAHSVTIANPPSSFVLLSFKQRTLNP